MNEFLKSFNFKNKDNRKEWLNFEGEVKAFDSKTDSIILLATDGSNGIIKLAAIDFRSDNGKLFLFLGAKVEVVKKPLTHPQSFNTSAAISSNCVRSCKKHKNCKGCERPDTFATGSVELCCYDETTLGNCAYYWKCKYC
jgi:hypothetical protein